MRRLALALFAILATTALAVACSQGGQGSGGREGGTSSGTASAAAASSGTSATPSQSTGSSPRSSSRSSSDVVSGGQDAGSTGVAAKAETGKGRTSGAPGSTAKARIASAGFSAVPQARGGTPGAADSIQDIRFGRHGGYDRLVIDFGKKNGAAVSVPLWRLSSPAGEGYSRIYLPGVRSTSASGGKLGGSIMDDYYVVRAPNGGLFVDVFATGGFRYRVFGLDSPGRLVIDYQPSGSALGRPLPVRGRQVVVMEPRKGESVSSPLTVEGYARTFEGQVTVLLKNSNGDVIARKSTKANDWSSTWGYFRTTLGFRDFSGTGTLQVGSASAKTGQFEGVSVPVSGG